jgi:putative ABC transport system permease protein
MVVSENFRIALAALWANRMRSLLTALGIIIGVAAVIAVVSLVQGLQFLINNQLQGVGSNFVIIDAKRQPQAPGMVSRQVLLTWDDGLEIRSRVPGIQRITPQLFGNESVKFRELQHTTFVIGTNADWPEVNNFNVDRGRFFSQLDLADRKKVAVLGREVISELGLGDEPIGREIYVGRFSLTVIGVMEEKGRSLGFDYDDMVFVPYDTALSIFGKNAGDQIRLQLKTDPAADMERVRADIKRVLRTRHRLGPDDSDDFDIVTQDELLDITGNILGAITLVLGLMVSIGLLVGGIGIMNIMLVSVTERTREIGLRKAVGAKRQQVLLQFLIEAVVLAVLGGVIGIGLGYLAGVGIVALFPSDWDWPPAHVPIWAAALAFGFSAFVGIVSGIYPAIKASALDPIDSLRYE